MSAHAGYGGGTFTTPLVTFSGSRLEVNMDGSASGWLQVEIQSLTQLVEEGPNQMKVVNSRANHMSTYPTTYVYEGQTVSGLLGPVRFQFLSEAVFRIDN